MADTTLPGGGNGTFAKWLLSIIASLLAALVIALWSGNARLAVVEVNTSNIKEAVADHEVRVRRLERITVGRGGRAQEDGSL
jgi:hypothetical protein